MRIFSTDHKVIGLQYAFTSLAFLLVGFLLILAIRWHLAWPTAALLRRPGYATKPRYR